MWDSRYGEKAYAYGKEPNHFFKEALGGLNLTGKMLLPAEGEGRNAVYAAQQNWDVFAFDMSIEGKKKAISLAAENDVHINYEVGEFLELEVVKQTYDAAALIYAHFPPHLLSTYYKKVAELTKPGGVIILEGFSKGHLPYRLENPAVGGPGDESMLLSVDQVKKDFVGFEPLLLNEVEIELHEGLYHNGIGKVLRFIGRKPSS